MKYQNVSFALTTLVFLLATLCASSRTETLPSLKGETLSNKTIVLPGDVHGKVAFLVFGFSRKGGQEAGKWTQTIRKDFGSDPRYAVYSIAVLEDAPRMFRGMIRSGIRSGIPVADRDRFIVIVEGGAGIKRLAGFSVPDDAYIILMDDSGNVRWKAHGRFAESFYAPRRDAAVRLLQR